MSHHDLKSEAVVKIVDTLFSTVTLQSLSQQARQSAYGMLAALMTKHLNVLKTIAMRFIPGFVEAMEP